MVCAAALRARATALLLVCPGVESSQIPPGDTLGSQGQLQMDVCAPGRALGTAGMRGQAQNPRPGAQGGDSSSGKEQSSVCCAREVRASWGQSSAVGLVVVAVCHQ